MATPVETAVAPIPERQPVRLCCLKRRRPLPKTLDGARLQAIGLFKKFWVAGTQVTYAFVPGGAIDSPYQRNAVRKAFGTWAKVGLNITFKEEKDDWKKAKIRISFDIGGSHSAVGTDAITFFNPDQATMNFGWDLAGQPGTAEHEIGHALGLDHEHQNPISGLVWDEPAVMAYFKGAPNFWSETDIHENVLDKIPQWKVKGSPFDVHSIMEYEFDGKLIKEPEDLRKNGIPYNSELSETDKTVVQDFYPGAVPMAALNEFVVTPFAVAQGQTAQAQFVPKESAEYTVSAHGTDLLLTLHDHEGNTIAAQDIAGEDDKKGAVVSAPLKAGETYTVSVRRYFDADGTNQPLMVSAFHRVGKRGNR
eukprot:TRINITY_DN9277_c0_g1_i2.p1 TRINITY_DN9277_c0_g1~~TRINITY_DN9277_c0_g1_i2.p1  ORF type:complete len:364 (+),score=109.11 TRINITY_DN9277_c0_g1_i2:93-1184(+)